MESAEPYFAPIICITFTHKVHINITTKALVPFLNIKERKLQFFAIKNHQKEKRRPNLSQEH